MKKYEYMLIERSTAGWSGSLSCIRRSCCWEHDFPNAAKSRIREDGSPTTQIYQHDLSAAARGYQTYAFAEICDLDADTNQQSGAKHLR
ncbi:hypothetical protein [Escherichia coli]|uniref:hypothetical protein n=1 Tax=Escherichia coli TaxID=562 RepID=UPI000ABEED4C|nr:hypothetical protein [Escherichia coli]